MRVINAKQNVGVLPLGKTGENKASQIIFDISGFETYEIKILHRRSGDELPYSVADYVVNVEDHTVTWTVSNVDTGKAGFGETEIQFLLEDTVVKTEIWRTRVNASISDEVAPPPDPYEGVVEKVLAAASKAEENASAAGESARQAQIIVDDGKELIDKAATKAEEASDSAGNASRAASEANAAKEDAVRVANQADKTMGEIIEGIESGILIGPPGKDGEPGKDGDPGVYVGEDEPTDKQLWINPTGDALVTEEWEFELEDGSTVTKEVLVYVNAV